MGHMHRLKVFDFLTFLVFSIVLLVSALPVAARAAEKLPYFAASGLYITASGTRTDLNTGLDSQEYVPEGVNANTTTTDNLFMAKPKDGWGFGVGAGYRGPFYAIELNYYQSFHDDFSDILGSGSSSLKTLSLDFKYFFLAKYRIQPYIMAGLAYNWFTQTDRAAQVGPLNSGGATSYEDADYKGWGPNAGGGISIFITPRVAVDTGFIYRYVKFSQASGFDTVSLRPPVDMNIYIFKAGLSYTFDMSGMMKDSPE